MVALEHREKITNRSKVLVYSCPSVPDVQGTRRVHRYGETPVMHLDTIAKRHTQPKKQTKRYIVFKFSR